MDMETYIVDKARHALDELCSDRSAADRITQALSCLIDASEMQNVDAPESVKQVLRKIALYNLDPGSILKANDDPESETALPRRKMELLKRAIELIFAASS